MSLFKKPTPVKVIALAAGLALIPAIALAELAEGDQIGTTQDEITAQLVSQGYEVKEIELEDDEFEVEVVLNGQEFEIEIDAKAGTNSEIETADSEENDSEDAD